MAIMMFCILLFAAIAVAQNSSMPTSTSVYDIGVPTEAPVPGLYNGAWRPQVHFSPPRNFMNDPNGCFRDDNGTWHLYYQCKYWFARSDSLLTGATDNPTATVAGNQHVINLFLCPMPRAPYFTGRENETRSGLPPGSLPSKQAGH
jgi:beta-fructofuranosidase